VGRTVSFTPHGLIVDMDGVLYRGNRPLPGLRDFFAALCCRPFRLVTNNSLVSPQDCSRKLAAMGVAVAPSAILTVSEATGRYLAAQYPAGSRCQVLGSTALRAAVAAAGLVLVSAAAEVVVAGLDTGLSYPALAEAVRALAAGAGLVATSLDPVLLTEDGPAPGAGAVVAALRACVPTAPVCVGKPSPAMFSQAVSQLALPAADVLVVGDSLASDIAGGRSVGARTALLLTGLSSRADVRQPDRPDLVMDGLPELSAFLRGAWQRGGVR
jgi:4-nitrophenyl phosphatase